MEQVTGRLTKDAQLTEVRGGKKVINFTIVIEEKYRYKRETKQVMKYISCACWIMPGLGQYLKEGLLVELSGRIGCEAWIGLNGIAKSKLTFNASAIKILSYSKASYWHEESQQVEHKHYSSMSEIAHN